MRDHRIIIVLALLLLAARPAAQLAFVDDADFPVPGSARLIAGGDLDADGDLDLVVCSVDVATNAGSAQVWLNDGAAHLTQGEGFTVLSGVASASLVDLNADDRLDLLLVAPGTIGLAPGAIQVNLGDGAGGFGVSINEFIAGTPQGPALADINSDGVLDLGLATPGISAVATLTAAGNGAFSAPTILTAGANPVWVALPDLQLDGDPDLLALNSADPAATVTRRFGGPGTSFGAPLAFATTPTMLTGSRLSVALLDGDAFPDVLVYGGPYGVLTLLRGDGAGGLLPGTPMSIPEVTTSTHTVDLDLDGDLDVEHSAYGGGPLSGGLGVMLSDGSGTLASVPGALQGAALNSACLGDFDGDLLPDAAGLEINDRLEMRFGNGLGGFRDVPAANSGLAPNGAALADFDEDGRPDLVTGQGPVGTVSVWANDGFGALLPATFIVIAPGPQVYTNDTATADIDGDGHQDIVFTGGGENEVGVLHGDGAGGFGPAVESQAGAFCSSLEMADVDGDADPDVIGRSYGSYAVTVLRNDSGALQPGTVTAMPKWPVAMAVGDIDGDADPDAVVASQIVNAYTLLRGDGAGGWLPLKFYAGVAVNQQWLGMGDLNGDGFDDFVAVRNSPDGMTGLLDVRMADGTGALLPPTSNLLEHGTSCLELADIDLDGTLDALIGHDQLGLGGVAYVSVVRGDGQGGFAEPEPHFLGKAPTEIVAGDMNGDGLPDIVTASAGQYVVCVLLNMAGFESPWTQLGSSLSGAASPKLTGAGLLLEGTPGHVTLFDAPPFAPAVLFIALSSSPHAFKGGTLVPVPPLVTLPFMVPSNGLLQLAWSEWPATSSGLSFYAQAAVADAGAPAGVSLSGALRGVTP